VDAWRLFSAGEMIVEHGRDSLSQFFTGRHEREESIAATRSLSN
jgi:hypothetical protein